jgi:hypothetical protein
MSNDLKAIQKTLREKSTPEGLAANQKFVPGSSRSYGVRNPVLNELSVQFKSGALNW